MGQTPLSVEVRFWSKVAFPSCEDDCWLWTAAHDLDDYGLFWPAHGHRTLAHRFAYELTRSPIPPGLQIDHLCRNPSCVNPTHLEVVTSRENTMRGENFSAVNARKTHCIHGHPFNMANTYSDPNSTRRACRQCRAEGHRRRRKAARTT